MSNKALLAHQRVKHRVRNPVKNYVIADATCPVCKISSFSTRLRAIAHLSEKRCRGRSTVTCYDQLQQGEYRPLPAELVDKLDEADRTSRRSAMRNGRTTPLALYTPHRSKTRGIPDETYLTLDGSAQRPNGQRLPGTSPGRLQLRH